MTRRASRLMRLAGCQGLEPGRAPFTFPMLAARPQALLRVEQLQQEVEQVGDRHLQQKAQPLFQRRLAEEA